MGKRVDCIPPETMAAFQWYSRPGNIRELQNISKVQQASVSSNASIPSSANVASPCRVGRRAFACTICGTPLPPPNLPQLVATIGRQASGPHAVVETDRYAHVADAALRSASDVFGEVLAPQNTKKRKKNTRRDSSAARVLSFADMLGAAPAPPAAP